MYIVHSSSFFSDSMCDHFLRWCPIFPVLWPQMLGPVLRLAPPPHLTSHIASSGSRHSELIPDNQPQTRPRSVSAFRSNGNWFNQIQICEGWDWFNTPKTLQNVDSPPKLKRLQEISKSLSRHRGASARNKGENNGEVVLVRGQDQDDIKTMETRGSPDHPDLDWVIPETEPRSSSEDKHQGQERRILEVLQDCWCGKIVIFKLNKLN